MQTIKLSQRHAEVIYWALHCMEEHIQYEDEWSDEERESWQRRYREAQAVIEPALPSRT